MAGDSVALATEQFTTRGCSMLLLAVVPCPLRAGLFFDYAVNISHTEYNVKFAYDFVVSDRIPRLPIADVT